MLGIFGLLALTASVASAAPAGPSYALHVTYELASAACRWKPIGLVNGTSPGPAIEVAVNQTAWIRVYNDMENQNLTMHMHSIGASVPFADGSPMGSQWPIAPGQYFDYEIRPNKAGSYFYQSQIGFQAVSVSGPIIVTDPPGTAPYAYDEEKLIFLQEFYNQTNEVIEDGLMSTDNHKFSGETEAILINGNSYPAVSGECSQTPPPYYTEYVDRPAMCGPEVFDVEPSKTYRFRTIAGAAMSIVAFEVEDHNNLTVVNVDGEYTLPAYTDMIVAGPGQRYDFLLTTKSVEELGNKSEYWIQFETRLRPTTVTSYAILRYTTSSNSTAPSYGNSTSYTVPAHPPATAPLSIPTSIQGWLEYGLKPLSPAGFPPAQNVSRTIYLTHAQTPDGLFWTVNNHSWTPTNNRLNGSSPYEQGPNLAAPYLIQIYQQGDAAIPDFEEALLNGGYSEDFNAYVGDPTTMEVIDIVLLNTPNGRDGGYQARSWHAHGTHMWDLGSGTGTYNAAANNAKINATFGARGPAKRDTTNLYTYEGGDSAAPGSVQGWRALRLRVVAGGVWMMNSEVIQEQIMGLQTVWILGNASEVSAYPSPYVSGYLEFGGSAVGNATVDPLVTLFPN